MLRKILTLLLLFSTTRVYAQNWSCNIEGDPPECSQANFNENFSVAQHDCLLKLQMCGRYQSVVDRLAARSLGLSVEQKYFLGLANFGLSNRTDAQSLKCFYMRQAKTLLEEFLYDVETNPAENISLASQQRVDALYQASRVYTKLKAETGCAESSFSEGSIDRMARKMTHDSLRTLMQGSEDGTTTPTQAQNAAKQGFDSVRLALSGIVTDSSTLESRFVLYQTQLKSSKEKIGDLAKVLKAGLGENSVRLIKNDQGFSSIEVDLESIKAQLDLVRAHYESQGKNPLSDLENKLQSFFVSNATYYDSMNADKVKEVKDLMKKLSLYVNTIQVKSPEAQSVHAVLSEEQPGFETPLLIKGPIQDFFKKGMRANCSATRAEDYWYCDK
jgi:phosphopantetheine adenylyltransferase